MWAVFQFMWATFQCPRSLSEADITPCGHYTTKQIWQSDSINATLQQSWAIWFLRLLYHKASVTAVTLLTVPAYKSSQNLYFIEKNSLRNRRSRACFQSGIKICLSTPQDAQVVNQVFKIGGELFWFPEDEAASRCFACSLKEITVL